jgi:hypothetical protein
MHVTMNLLVRDEIDILEYNIRYHSSIGVDKFFVMDHLSVDGTSKLLDKLSKEFDIVIIPQKSPKYMQSEWMNELGRLATKSGTDWIINSDADEFWKFPIDMKEFLKDKVNSTADCIQCPWRNFVSTNDSPLFFDNIWYKIEESPFYKTIFKPHENINIAVGNHWVFSSKSTLFYGDVKVYHYSDRNRCQLYRKYINGAKALELSGYPEYMGKHWRLGLKAFQNGEFSQFGDKLLLPIDQRIANGEKLEKDEAMKCILENIKVL